MNIIEFTKKFHDMEMNEKLFELKTSDGIYFWDIVRYDVFNLISKNEFTDKLYPQRNIRDFFKISLLKKIAKDISDYKNDTLYYKIKQKSEYVFLSCSRTVIKKKNIDIISADYLNEIKDRSFIIETLDTSSNNLYYKNTLLKYKKKINNFLLYKNEDYFNINDIINRNFHINVNLDSRLNLIISNFRVEKKYYSQLLQKIRPKAIFFVQNGIQKALIHSCKELNIPCIELQHGIINYSHPTYSFPRDADIYLEDKIILPDTFFALSSFWINNVNFPVKNSIAMGNSYYGKLGALMNSLENKNEITFISANTYQSEIDKYIEFMINQNFDIVINLKLHPNQIDDLNDIKLKYKNYSNINVWCNEVTLLELFGKSKEVILITSTAAYEAIQCGCNVGIIKTDMSYHIYDLFDNPNVRLLESPKDIMNIFIKSYSKKIFFEKFDDEKFKKFINEL